MALSAASGSAASGVVELSIELFAGGVEIVHGRQYTLTKQCQFLDDGNAARGRIGYTGGPSAAAAGGRMYAPETTSIGDTMGLTMGTGPFGKQPAGTFNFEPDAPKSTRSTSSRRRAGCAASSAARRSSTRPTWRCCTRRATCPSGTSRARTCASTCSRRPITRRTARSRATPATGRSAPAARSPRTRSGAIPRSCPRRPTSPIAWRSTGMPSITGTRRTRRSSSTRATRITASTSCRARAK